MGGDPWVARVPHHSVGAGAAWSMGEDPRGRPRPPSFRRGGDPRGRPRLRANINT